MSPSVRHLVKVGLAWGVFVGGLASVSAQPAPTSPSLDAPARCAPVASPRAANTTLATPPPPAEAPWTAKDWAAVLSGPLGLLGALIAVWIGARNSHATIAAAQRSGEAALVQKANEAELESHAAALGAFYGPFLQLSEANALLAREFRARQQDPDFRLLVGLLDPNWRSSLSPTDRTIVEEIVKIDAELERLIREKAGQVEEDVLAYLARATAHFRIMQLAWNGALENDPERIRRYAYPWQLDEVLKTQVARIRSRCERLRSEPGVAQGPMPDLELRAGLELTPWPQDDRARRRTPAAPADDTTGNPVDGLTQPA